MRAGGFLFGFSPLASPLRGAVWIIHSPSRDCTPFFIRKKADSHASHTFNPVSIPHPQVETFPLLHYFLGIYPNIVAIP
jgi:hypothetical protein